jgi:hypothetical protein
VVRNAVVRGDGVWLSFHQAVRLFAAQTGRKDGADIVAAAVRTDSIEIKESSTTARLLRGVVVADPLKDQTTVYSLRSRDVRALARGFLPTSRQPSRAMKPSHRDEIVALIGDASLTKKQCRDLVVATFPDLRVTERQWREIFRLAPRQKGRRPLSRRRDR